MEKTMERVRAIRAKGKFKIKHIENKLVGIILLLIGTLVTILDGNAEMLFVLGITGIVLIGSKENFIM